MSDSKLEVYKFTLSSGKVIYLKEPTILDSEHATKVAGNLAGSENAAYLGTLYQKEMVKALLVQVGENKLSMNDKANIQSIFNFKEYGQVLKALKAVTGDDEGNFDLTPGS